MTDQPRKTIATQAVEGFLSSAVSGFMAQAARVNPAPILAEEGETISPVSITKQISKHLANRDHMSAGRLALVLASWIARSEGMSMGEAMKLAGVSWTETANLPSAPK